MFWKKEKSIIHGTGSLAQYEFDGDDYDRYYLAMRAIVRQLADLSLNKDSYAVVPKNLDSGIDFLRQIYSLENFSKERIFETDDTQYLLWQNVMLRHFDEFIDWIELHGIDSNEIGLYPYASAPDYWEVYDSLQRHGLSIITNMDRISEDEIKDPSHFVHKGTYYRWVGRRETNKAESGFSFLSKPQGIVAETYDELLLALKEMEKKLQGNKPILFKQIFAGGGYGIDFFNSISEARRQLTSGKYKLEQHPYDDLSFHPVLVQEAIDIVHDNSGELGISVQYDGRNIIGITRTLSDGKGHWTGNILIDTQSDDTFITKSDIRTAKRMSQKLLHVIRPKGRGGIDLLVANGDSGRMVNFIEVNGGRTTGAEEAVRFKESLGQVKGVVGLYKYEINKIKGYSAELVYEILKRNNIPTVIITKEKNQIIKKWSTKMRVDKLFDGVKNKEKIILKLCNIYNLSENNIAYIGDDVNDLEILKRAGFSATPKDGNLIVKKIVDYTCKNHGGEGVLREICDLVISTKFGKKSKLY